MPYYMFKLYFYKLLAMANNTFIKYGIVLASFFGPVQGIIFLCIMLAFMDFFVKLHVVYITEGRRAIKSKKIENTIYKIIFYSLAIIVAHLIDIIFIKDVGHEILKLLFNDASAELFTRLKLAAGVAFIIILRELKSIDESWEQRFGWSFFEMIQKYGKNIFTLRHNDPKTSKNKRSK